MSGLPGSTPEPYLLRKAGLGQILPPVLFAVWIAALEAAGLDFPLWVLVVAATFPLVRLVLDTERLRIDADGVRVRPAARIPWAQIDAVSQQGPDTVGVRLKPGAALPRGTGGMVDGEHALSTRGAEIDRARFDRAVRDYSAAGGSFSGTPGQRRVLLGMSAGGPSGWSATSGSSRPRAGWSGTSGSSGVMVGRPRSCAGPTRASPAHPRGAAPRAARPSRRRAGRSRAAR